MAYSIIRYGCFVHEFQLGETIIIVIMVMLGKVG